MRLSLALTAAAVAAAILTAPAGAHIPRSGCNSHLAPRAELRCALLNEKHARDVVGWARARLGRTGLLSFDPAAAARLGAIARNHAWLTRIMAARAAEARRRVAAASLPPHAALWLCIQPHEGAWNDPNSGGNGHYGGLQMHPDWGYGTSHHASDDPPLTQMWAAERGYRASGFSRSWLSQQWGQTIGPCWSHA